MRPDFRPFAQLAPFLLVLAAATAPETAWAGDATAEGAHPHLEARLLANQAAVRPGDTLLLGVHLRMDPHWHVYWKQSGDSGLPPKLTWKLPPEFRVGPQLWPVPKRHVVGPLVTYVYDDEVLLPIRVQVPFDLAGKDVKFEVAVDWLVCEDSEGCIPGEATLDLTLPITHDEARPAKAARRFAATLAKLPERAPDGLSLAVDEQGIALKLVGAGPWQDPAARFQLQPATWEVFDSLTTLHVSRGEDGVTLEADFMAGVKTPTALSALLVVERDEDRRAYEIVWRAPTASQPSKPEPQAATEDRPAPEPAPVPPTPAVEDDLSWAHAYVEYDAQRGDTGGTTDLGFLGALLLAFLGGIILNVMPCVLPVLSLKIVGFVDQAGGDPVRARRHGYAFAAGVVGCFLAVAGVLIAARYKGADVGWGFQLQEPAVVVGLSFLMFLLGLNLVGLFEVGQGLTGLAGRATQHVEGKGYLGSVGTGALATVIATPCTAPFMGPAIGYALTQPAVAALGVFAAIGAGMAAPYVLLSIFPRWLRFLPKPGPWMVTLKQGMAFPMFATVIWLVWVYARQVGADSMAALLGGLLVCAAGAWLYGRYGTAMRSARVRWVVGRGLALALVVAGIALALPGDQPIEGADTRVTTAPEGWVAYDGHRIRASQAAGRPVFLDFTADWCLTCKANEAAFLDTDEVRAAFERHRVLPMQADWTRRDARITKALARLDRSSVPLYVIVPAAPDQPAVVLRTAITTGYVLEALDGVLGDPRK